MEMSPEQKCTYVGECKMCDDTIRRRDTPALDTNGDEWCSIFEFTKSIFIFDCDKSTRIFSLQGVTKMVR